MTKRITALALSVVAMSAIIIGCKKEKEVSNSSENSIMSRAQDRELGYGDKGGTETDEYYVQMIFDQSEHSTVDYGTFAHMIDRIGNNTTDLFTDIYNAGGIPLINDYKEKVRSMYEYRELDEFYNQYGMNKELQLERKSENLGTTAAFFVHNPEFYELDNVRQQDIIKEVFVKLSDPLFQESHPTHPMVVAYKQVIDRLTASPYLARLTMEEVGDCLRDVVVGAIAGSWGVIRDLYNAITGYNLGWSGIKRVAGSALQTIVGSNAVGAAIGFGLCIAWETFF